MVKAWETTTLSAGFQPIGRIILREAPPLANVCPYWNRCAGGQKIQSYMRVYTLTCISSNGKAKHLSAPKCTVKSHQKLYRITGWKHGNVETEWKHVMKLAYFTTHLRFFLEIFLWLFFVTVFLEKLSHLRWILKKPSLIWNLDFDTCWRDYCEQNLTPKHGLTPNHILKSASWPRYTREEQHLESVRGRCRGASLSGELVKRVSFWEMFSANPKKHIDTLKCSG